MDYKTIGQHLQIEGDKTHADQAFLAQQGIKAEGLLPRLDGIRLFNQIAVKQQLAPLRDPLGYMTLSPNVHDLIRETYRTQYEHTKMGIEAGAIQGGAYGMAAVLKRNNAVARHDITPFLPKGLKYGELRFMRPTKQIRDLTNKFVQTRIRLTFSYGLRRRVEARTIKGLQDQLAKTGHALGKQFSQAAGMSPKPRVKLSSEVMLANNNNKAALISFATQLKHPDQVTKASGDEHATASFVAADMPTAKFLLASKSYLEELGFTLTKASGHLTTSWQSKTVDRQYQKETVPPLNLSGLNEAQALE